MLAMILATACDDKNESNYEPGQPTAEGSMGVYFDNYSLQALSELHRYRAVMFSPTI